MNRTISIARIDEAVQEAYEFFRTADDGKNADYIPYLEQVDPKLFGISLCLPDGALISHGDTDFVFGIESVAKVHTAILVLRQHGADEMLNKIGANATGLPFNSVLALLPEMNQTSTPLVNAGAITACSMVEPRGDAMQKWRAICDNITELCAGAPQVIGELYHSESKTNFTNRSITWLLKSYGRLYDDPDMSLDLYTHQCSLGVTAEQLAISGATIACGGFNPVTGKRVFDASLAPEIISMLATVGFYEDTGEWMYRSGLPAKSGVGGAVMGVMPGLFGICAFSPPLDSSGNSVRAQLALRHIMDALDLNVFSCDRVEITSK